MSRRFLAIAAFAAVGCTVQHVSSTQSMQTMDMNDHMAHMNPADLRAPAVPASKSTFQGDLKLPPSAQTAAARLAASPRHGEWVKFAVEPGSKDTVMAWIVYPLNNPKAPVVVVVHEIFGLSTWIRGVADQVAAEGFIAIAPDFLSRVRPGGPSTEEFPAQQATQLIGQINSTERNAIISAAANFAMVQPSAQQRYAVIGYCWGGQTTFFHVINNGVKGFSGGVAYYGAPYMSQGQRATATAAAVPGTYIVDSLKKINKPVILLNGDARISASMPALDSLMKSLHKDYVGTDYKGAAHGFLRLQADTGNNPAAAANLEATKDAWPKTVAFLKKNLGVK